MPRVPAEGSHVVRVERRSPAVAALRRVARAIPGARPAYRTVARARIELRMAYHAVRASLAARLRRAPDGETFVGQAPGRVQLPPADGPGLHRLLAASGVELDASGDRLSLLRDERVVAALGERFGLYPPGSDIRLARVAQPGGEAPARESRLRDSLLAANVAHLRGAGPRPLDALEVSVGDEQWIALVSAPEMPPASRGELEALVERGELVAANGALHWDQLRVPNPEDLVRPLVGKEAQSDLHFGRETALLGRYLYQSVPTVGARGRRDSARRWALLSSMLAEAGVEVRERLVCDVGCNAGMMLGAALGEGAAWGLGWDLPPVVERAQGLMRALGYSRFDLFGAELTEDYPLREDVPAHLRPRLDGAVVLYLAIRHHVGFLRELGEIPWSALVYEGGETETVQHLDESLRELRELCDFSVACARDFRDSETDARPVAVLVRR